MSFLGFPDWQSPQRIGDRILYAAFEEPKSFYLAPEALDVATEPDGAPAFRLDLFQQDRHAAGLARFGLLGIRFAARFDMSAARQAIFAQAPDLRLRPLGPETGLIRLSAASAFALPQAASNVQILDLGGVGSMAMTVRLDGASADLLIDTLRQGLSTIWADAWIAVRGVAARFPRIVTFDPAALRAALVDPSGSVVALDALRARLCNEPADLPLRVSALVANDEAIAFADAFVDRFAGSYGAVAPSPDGTSGAWLKVDPAAMPSGEVRWDLSTPSLAPRVFALAADPLGPARGLFGPEAEARLVRRIDVPALQSGWRSLSLASNIPDRRAGVLRLAVEITVPPNPPARPQTLKSTVLLEPGERLETLDLRLAPGEPLDFTWQTLAFVTAGGGVEPIAGPVRRHTREHLTVSPDAFHLRFITVAAEPSFLTQVSLLVECSGERRGRSWAIGGVIDAARPSLTFVVPHDVLDARTNAIATALSDGAARKMPPVPAAPLWLDPFSFEGSGMRRLIIHCDFDAAAADVLIECAPQDRIDDPTRHSLIRLTPASPAQEWSWLALSPFRSGYCWRWKSPDGDPPSAWSQAQEPDAPLILKSSQRLASATGEPMMSPIVIDGVELMSVKDQPRTYAYRPVAAGIARGHDSRAQLSLIEAGPVAMLALTTMWGVTGEALEAMRAKLAARLNLPGPEHVMLMPAMVEVGEVALLLGDGTGSFQPFLTGNSSGAPPYHTAFSATLTEDQKSTVKKALGGKRGYLAVRYEVTDRPAAASRSEFSSRSSESATFTLRTASAGDSTTTTRDEVHEAASSPPAPAPLGMRVYQTDAADWGLNP